MIKCDGVQRNSNKNNKNINIRATYYSQTVSITTPALRGSYLVKQREQQSFIGSETQPSGSSRNPDSCKDSMLSSFQDPSELKLVILS